MGDSIDSFSFTEWETALDAPSNALSDDGREFHELKFSSKLTKTNEEIMAFSVDESLGDIDRALYLLKYAVNDVSRGKKKKGIK
ncbi:hypothetical protein HMI54_004216 [Coelomomyces lativittatus]|nr:hypothetical protein HMI54_004216 [Coelomomyces lativittatus]KAJ1512448.1 hypothetical protein HMI55_006225 [Coelomomyces lativittatus]